MHHFSTSLFHTVTSVRMEDFLCDVHSDHKAECSKEENCLSVSIEASRRDPENGIVKLTLHLVYTPVRTCRLLSDTYKDHMLSKKINT